MVLSTVREVGHYSCRSMTGNCAALAALADEPGYAQINTEDAKRLGKMCIRDRFWDKYGTFFILAIIVAIFGSLSPEYFLTTNNITQIFVQSSVTVLIGMGEFFAILVAGIDLSVGAILALSGMVTAKLMLAGVDRCV